MRIPFDSLTLAAVVDELQQFVGGKLQRVIQPNETDLALGIYAQGGEGMLLISCHAVFSRAHLITKRPGSPGNPPALCAAIRARCDGARIAGIYQENFDRILRIEFERQDGMHTLVAELMGKHSNTMFMDETGRILAAAKWVNRSKSKRPIQAGARYEPPPFPIRKPLYLAEEGDLKDANGASPFLLSLLKAMGDEGIANVRQAVETGTYHPILSPGHGAYPISVAPLGLPEHPRNSISIALEQHFDILIPQHEMEVLRGSLVAQLERVILAREVALADLNEAKDTAARAGQLQLMGELILAYGGGLPPMAKSLEATDYDGNSIEIKLNPEKTFLENANRYFEKAKKAKSRQGLVLDQIQRLSSDRAEVDSLLQRVKGVERLRDLQPLQELARERRWLHSQPVPTKRKEERPYEGNRIRELQGPGGYVVLYGENSEANDYLTLRVAKPNDFWLHVRGSISAHVVIVTRNQPEKVPREALLYAAQVAVQNSPSKHSGYVPVDYTLKKYVRKPRGAPKGTALYTHEKTLHIEGK